jgi:hypothetical protein
MTKKIVYFGHHKCGSRFFRTQIFTPLAGPNGYEIEKYRVAKPVFRFETAHDLDFYNIDFKVLSSDKKIILLLANSGAPVAEAVRDNATEFRGLHVVRDPRQILVSGYFHHLEGHLINTGDWVWEKLAVDRPRLSALNREDGILYELDNITRDILDNQISAWKPDDRILEVKLEDFEADASGQMRRIADFLQLKEFAELNTEGGFRHANPDSLPWKQVFTPKIKKAFKERYGDLLVRLGYERGLDW